MQLTRTALSLLAAASSASAWELQYNIPEELFSLFGLGSTSQSTGSSKSASADTAASSCTYPAQYSLSHFTSWSPALNASTSYVAFVYSDDATHIHTHCSYNASSQPLTMTTGTGLTARYPCDNGLITFIWQPSSANASSNNYGKLTAIEETCPGQTTTKYEASGSVAATTLRCTKISGGNNATAATELSTGAAGTLCTADGSLVANFTSLQPSPLGQ